MGMLRGGELRVIHLLCMLIASLIVIANGFLLGLLSSGRDRREAPEPTSEPATGERVGDGETALAVPGSAPSAVSDVDADESHFWLKLSTGNLGLAAVGALSLPGLSLLSAGISAYMTARISRVAYSASLREGKIKAEVLDTLALGGALLSGLYVGTALCNALYFTGRWLLQKTEDRSRRDLVRIFSEQPSMVWLLKDGVEVEVGIETLQAGDIVVVAAGQVVPVDGIIRGGDAQIDQRVLTGESQPIEKGVGESVFASTLVLSGRVQIEVQVYGRDTVVAKIGDILRHTADYRQTIEARSQSLSDRSVLPLLGLSGLAYATVGVPGTIAMLGCNFADNLRVSGPLGMLNYLGQAAQQGVLIKDGRALELLQGIDTIVFDKTGTLTTEEPHLGTIHPCGEWSPEQILLFAAAVEAKQSHPIARAILAAAQAQGLPVPDPAAVRIHVGYGLTAEHAGHRLRVGSARFMTQAGIAISRGIEATEATAHRDGNTLVYVAVDDQLAGAIELRPTLRQETKEVLASLRQRGLSLCIISGDHEQATRRLAAELGIESYYADVLPADKAKIVASLKAQGRRVCFVGDGINDAIALKTADSSISLHGAATAATDTAQIVLLDGSLTQLPRLLQLAAEFQQNWENTTLAALAPGALCVGGIFLLRFNILATIVFFNASLAVSVGVAMIPAAKEKLRQFRDRRSERATTSPDRPTTSPDRPILSPVPPLAAAMAID